MTDRTERQTNRLTETEQDSETESQRERERERDRQRQTETDRDRDRERECVFGRNVAKPFNKTKEEKDFNIFFIG